MTRIAQTAVDGKQRADANTYFRKKYAESSLCAVPGHWPDFATIDEVDDWFRLMEGILESARDIKQNSTA